jgi:hypothetical protein
MNIEKFPVTILKNQGKNRVFPLLLQLSYCCLKDEFRHVATYSYVSLMHEGRSTFCVLRETDCKEK